MARNWKNILVNARMQGQQIAFCLGAYVLGCASMGVAAFVAYSRVMPLIGVHDSALELKIMNYVLTGGLPLIFAISIGLGLFTILPYALYVSHRTAGPVIAIRRYIRSLMQDDFNASLRLRETDDLQEIAHDLIQLGEMLQKREGRDWKTKELRRTSSEPTRANSDAA